MRGSRARYIQVAGEVGERRLGGTPGVTTRQRRWPPRRSPSVRTGLARAGSSSRRRSSARRRRPGRRAAAGRPESKNVNHSWPVGLPPGGGVHGVTDPDAARAGRVHRAQVVALVVAAAGADVGPARRVPVSSMRHASAHPPARPWAAAGPGRAEQGHRVEVGLAAAQAPVQAGLRRAARVARRAASRWGSPARRRWPAATDGSTGSYVVRRPPAWSMLTTGRPATIPANTTTPSPAASTARPGAPPRSTPR